MKKIMIGLCIFAGWISSAHAIANPAAEFCEKIGGKSEIVTRPDGEMGLCVLENGNIIEEWTLYRLLNGKTE